jgi:hypothetical protein
MFFLKRSLALHVYLFAGLLAAIVPMGLGYLVFNYNPAACYDSPCALPLLLITVPSFAAPALTVLFAVNRRLRRPIPDGWIPTTTIFACVGQVAISVSIMLLASPNIKRIFFSDILFVPQGFVVGLVVASVFWATLYLCGREITKP